MKREILIYSTLLRAIVALLVCNVFMAGQTTGTIEGALVDPTAAAVPGASIVVIETGTGVERRLPSDQYGRYLAVGLLPGIYEVTASHAGFRDQVRRGVRLGAGQTARIDFVLEIGESRDQIVVTADAPPVSTSVSGWGRSIDRRSLDDLPLIGRDLFDLSSQQPGASVPAPARRGLTQGPGVKVSVNGARPGQNGFRLDGVYINDASGSAPASAAGRLLGIETIGELRLVTSPFSAEYGRSAGAVVTAVSRSGGNAFHGSAVEFFRDSSLDAKNFFDDPEAGIPPLRKHQFGGMLAGPVVKNRLFFLASYEAIRETRSTTVSPLVPTADARRGILPVSGGTRIVPVAQEIRPFLELYPLPNGREFGDGTAEYVHQSTRRIREDYWAGKLDFAASERLRVSGRYTYDDAVGREPDPLDVWTFLTDSGYQLLHAEAQFVRSPTALHTLRAGFSRVRNGETSESGAPPDLSFAGGQPLGSMEIAGLGSFGGFTVMLRPRKLVVNDIHLNHEFVLINGRHTFRAGAGYDRVQFNQRADLTASGHYDFGSLEDFLRAQPRRGEVMLPGSDSIRGWRQNLLYGYVQDDLRISRNLSVGVGLRYEPVSTPTEVNGKIATLPNPFQDTGLTIGGPLFRNPSKDNFAPRASLAWDPFGSGRTVVRAGAGIFFDLISTRELLVAGVRVPPFFNRAVLSRPSFPDILRAAADAQPPLSLDGLDFYLNQPYLAQFQLSVERELPGSLVARVSYAGSRGIHLIGHLFEINTARPHVSDGGRLYFAENAPKLNAAFEQIGMRRTQFSSFYHGLSANLERRWRTGLRFEVSYTWGKSLDENSNASFADYAGAFYFPMVFSYRENKGPSSFDVRHVISTNFSYALPSWRNSRIGGLFGGWELHGLTQIQSGFPFSPSVGFDRARLRPARSDLNQRPDWAEDSNGTVILRDPARYFDPLAFALPAAGFYGNVGRGTLVGPGLFALDLGLHKVVWRRERHSLQVRVEGFNVTNHPNFQIPSSLSLFNSNLQRLGSAGRITETSTTSRQIQLAVKWAF